jgi:hypothetical protein
MQRYKAKTFQKIKNYLANNPIFSKNKWYFGTILWIC